MGPIETLRRLVAKSDGTNELITAIHELRGDLNDKLSGLQQAADNQARDGNLRLDQLIEAANNQSAAINERLGGLQQAADNQARDTNQRLDQLIEAANSQSAAINERLVGLKQAADNQSTALNLRLDKLIKAAKDQSAGANRRLDRLIGATPGEAQAVNEGEKDVISNGPLGETDQSVTATRVPIVPEWLKAESPGAQPLPLWAGDPFANRASSNAPRTSAPTNDMGHYQPLLDALTPWSGFVPKGYLVDFLGILTDANFRAQFGIDPATTGGAYITTDIPPLRGGNGEWWFETVNWLEAAREARGQFVMITLGACYGLQAVGAHRALQILNPMPSKLVAVEPEPESYLWVRKHFRDNGIDPDAHWLVNAAISNVNEPVLFPIGAPGSGANNCMATDTRDERRILVDRLIANDQAGQTLRNIVLDNTTGVMRDIVPGQGAAGEIKIVSAVTLRDLVSVFDVVDYIEADIQQSETRVFPPFLDLLREKVRRIHIGTHGAPAHEMLHDLFASKGWEILFSYAPDSTYQSELGTFEMNDGVLTVRNPDL